jgi:hypothetical protein
VAIYEAERMHPAAANAFLKTLEEPPSDTVIALTTPKLHAILPTIAGRCSITRLATTADLGEKKEVQIWLASYSAWLATLLSPACDEKNTAVTRMYLLLTQLETLVESLIAEAADSDGPDGESAGKKMIHGSLLLKIERATAEFFRENVEHVAFFPGIIAILEARAKLVALNVNFMACVEAFLIEIFLALVRVPS